MRIFRVLLYSYCSIFASFQMSNIPDTEPTLHQLKFVVPKDFIDGSLKSDFLQQLKTYFGIQIFIESGTFLGNTTAKAARIFDEVHSIEISPDFYTQALKRFQNIPNVHLHLGDSGLLLPFVLTQCKQKTLLYLDGHYDGGPSGKGNKNTPIMEELRAILDSKKSDCIIMIDDICDFQPSSDSAHIVQTCFADYPDLVSLIDQILLINSRYQICFISNALFVFPPTNQVCVSPLLRACTIDRLSTIVDLFSDQELSAAEYLIGSIHGYERQELETYFQAYFDFECQHGWRSFAGFWMGLIHLHQQNPHRAQEIFRQTIRHSLPGWRIDNYIHDVYRM